MATRRSVSERAAQRDRMEQAGRDRYSSLLRTLQAGQELPWQRRNGPRLAWHPIATTLIRAAILGILLWLAVTAVASFLREVRVDTWSGAGPPVTSGQRLDGCLLVGRVTDGLFPNWIRFEGRVYLLADSIRPMGFAPDPDFPSAGHRLGAMELFRVVNTPDGQDGQVILVRLETSAVGQVYRVEPACS